MTLREKRAESALTESIRDSVTPKGFSASFTKWEPFFVSEFVTKVPRPKPDESGRRTDELVSYKYTVTKKAEGQYLVSAELHSGYLGSSSMSVVAFLTGKRDLFYDVLKGMGSYFEAKPTKDSLEISHGATSIMNNSIHYTSVRIKNIEGNAVFEINDHRGSVVRVREDKSSPEGFVVEKMTRRERLLGFFDIRRRANVEEGLSP